jgi:hypothetical protein
LESGTPVVRRPVVRRRVASTMELGAGEPVGTPESASR